MSRRYRLRRLRPRRSYVRRRHYRRRRYWRRPYIRRPRAGAYFIQRMQRVDVVTTNRTGTYSVYSVSWKLNDYLTTVFFDYYQLLKVKWELKPATATNNWQFWGEGGSILDFDDTNVQDSETAPYPNNSSRKNFQARFGTKRYFTPKPWVSYSSVTENQSKVFPANNRQVWFNANNLTTIYLGLKWWVHNPYKASFQYNFTQIKTVWVRWRQSI
ncbi:putative capsid protein [Mongoose-associated circovirus]|uniref:Capsid protein n=1 Tax=Mongoose-associated circovirus Mon-1 TaxID=3070927 RepID=A0AA48XTC2_9CIRC|nr:putative capsid protein [Mongoose-associated circovirus]UBR88847.1 putative capsid protein [Mongoose-associated circovirus Mon-1]UBR88849.1 putative capsid protein [Mongoose-associated circovirus]